MPKKKQLSYNGMVLDSEEELQFCHYLEELVDSGFVSKFNRAESMELVPAAFISVGKKKKSLLRNLSYTPDFEIFWTGKGLGLFAGELETYEILPFQIYNGRCIVDVKGSWVGRNNSSGITFPIMRKVAFTKGVFVNKTIPVDLFRQTFLPKKLFLTKTGKEKSWPFPKRTLEQFLNDNRRNS